MSNENLSEQIAAATAYEGLHVPSLMQEWVDPVLDAAGVARGDRVLDVACGTGVLARGALSRVGAAGSVAGVDPGAGMLSVARELTPEVDWRLGTAEALPFEDGSFEAVVSQFGMMFFADRPTAVREMLRVLDQNGRIAVAVWDSLESSPGYAIEVDILQELAGTEAADAVRAPFNMGDTEALASLFTEAGVRSPTVTTKTGTASLPSIREMVEADLRGWLPVMGVELEEETIRAILEEAERALADFVTPEGRVEFESPAHIVAGTKP